MSAKAASKLSYRGIVHRLFKNIKAGCLVLQENQHTHRFGDQASPNEETCHIKVNNQDFYKMLVKQGSLGAAEAYLREYWDTDDLLPTFELLTKNQNVVEGADKGLAKFVVKLRDLSNHFLANTQKRSKKYISYHYDLSNDLFKLFLDTPYMQYSSAVYPNDDATLEEAQINKLKQIGDKLQLKPTDHLLEIGTGWGGLCVYMAQNYGCRVTTTTISQEQHDYAKARIKAAGLENRITLLLEDYRNLDGQYDKLVSIEMLEAVGHQYFANYFAKCNNLIKKSGLALIQVITINEQTYERAKTTVDFIKKYIFPGGCLPSITAIMDTCTKHTNLNLIKLCDIGLDYVKTLAEWRKRFWDNISDVKKLGFDERFIRMWDYYYCYCMAGFKQRYISDVHLLLQKYVYDE